MGRTKDGTPYSDEDTSKAAAESVDASALRAQVLGFLVGRGDKGSTCDEAEIALDMKHQTASARFWELETKHHKISRTEKKRLTRSGRAARVYVANS